MRHPRNGKEVQRSEEVIREKKFKFVRTSGE